jgi:Ca-activated chloride channel family protein
MTRTTRLGLTALCVAAASMLALAARGESPAAAAEGTDLTVRITSPLGRAGTPDRVRIVAQIHARPDAVLSPVQFYVDNVLLATDSDGPPYAVEWVDENPYEPRQILVQVQDQFGNVARDTVDLKPFEIVEVTGVTSVLVEASVQDKKGRFVSGLTADQFILAEDGEPQALQIVRQEGVAATFAMLIDSSQSMSRRMDFVREAATRLAGYMRPGDRMLVAPFSRRLLPLTGPTNDRKTVAEAITAIHPAGGTGILDSLIEISKHLSGIEGRRVIVLVTDGYDEHSESTFDEALQAVKVAGATVYVVGIGGVAGISLKGERLLRRLAGETGGQTFFPTREEELAAVHDRLATDAQNRYLITYTPTNERPDGKWRRISLKTSEPDYKVRAREGYFAQKPPPIRPSLEFTVTDRNQQYADVAADDLVVVEDGVEQKVETFQEAVAPVSIVLALDASGSMRKSADEVIQAARDFIQALRPADSLALVLFSDQVVFAHEFGTNRQNTLEAIGQYHATGGTALYDALQESLNRLRKLEGRRAIVVLTDGRDENNPGTAPGSVAKLDDVLALVKQVGAAVYTLGLGTKVDRAPLEELARVSGGQAYFPFDVSVLKNQYGRVVENLRRRFVLSYTATNSSRDGSWRSVEIRTRSSNILVSSQAGYFAPER